MLKCVRVHVHILHVYHGTFLYVQGRTIKPKTHVSVVMVLFLTGNSYIVDMREIIMYQELYVDMWSGVGVFGPMSLHWLPRDALLGCLVIL